MPLNQFYHSPTETDCLTIEIAALSRPQRKALQIVYDALMRVPLDELPPPWVVLAAYRRLTGAIASMRIEDETPTN